MTDGMTRRAACLGAAALPLLTAAGRPLRDVSVRDHGAVGDGRTLDTPAINRAITAAARAGGGTVRFPRGRYLSFSIRLASDITLLLEAGAVIEAANPAIHAGAYDPPEDGPDLYQDFGHSHWHNSLIWGVGVRNVGIVGPGTIDGKGLTRHGPGARWSKGTGERPLSMGAMPARAIAELEPARARTVGQGNKAIALKNARNVTLRDFTVRKGGHFAVLLTGVDDVVIDGLRIDTDRDGIDLDGVRGARVTSCRVNSPNDDAIVLKSSYALGEARACEDVRVSGCVVSGYDMGSMLDGTRRRTQQIAPDRDRVTGRIKLGTESNGGFRNIRIDDCRFERSRGLALETVDGGVMENIAVSGLTMREVTTAPLFLRLGDRRRGPDGTGVGAIRGVTISGVDATGIDHRFPATIAGLTGHPIEDVTLRDVRLVYAGGGTAQDAARVPPELPDAYPEPSMFGTLPAWGLWMRHARGVRLDGVRLETATPDARPPIVAVSTRDVIARSDAAMDLIRRLIAAVALAAAAPALAQVTPVPAPGFPGKREFGRVAFDRHSLIVDGKRLVVWSGEMHPFRLPSPDLWRDILQKMKATGFNTVAFYFDWGYHSPKPGVYDFSGIRDIDRLLTMASEEGLYVLTRAGPYVNAELSRGGFPGWLVNQSARARTDDPVYLAASDEWLGKINKIIARHQLGTGKGTVILHQIENELLLTTPAQVRYMEHLYAKVRADGITVPVFTNDIGRNGYWVPKGSGVAKTVEGPTDLYAFDGYPGGTCTVQGEVTRSSAAPDWGSYGPGGAKGGASASPHTPGFLAEFGGGWFDYWGSNGGYECNAIQRGRRYQRVFYGTNLANNITLQSFYVAYGGTSWGWLPAPVVFTSYDYGAAISEARELRPKAMELKQLGDFIQAVPDLAQMDKAAGVTASSPAIQIYHNRNPLTDARFLMVTHKPSNAQSNDRFTVTAKLPDGDYRFPLRLNGFDAKWLVAGVNLARQRLVYSTSELQTVLRQGEGDVALFYGRAGETGETVLRYASAPSVTVLDGTVESRFDAARGDLKLSYAHGALARVRIDDGGRAPLTLLIGDEAVGASFWRRDDVLVRGPAMLRAAKTDGSALALTGDTAAASDLEVWAAGATRVSWNGRAVATGRTTSGSLLARSQLAGPATFALPALTDWRVSDVSPETAKAFDDSGWKRAGGAPNTSTVRPPDGQPNLGMDAHGFHHGDVWYRGRFAGGAAAKQVTVHYGAGGAGLLQLWLDGRFVGQHELAGGLPRPITTGVATFPLPPEARAPGEHVLTAMVRNNGHNWDLEADEFHKETRGLVSASIDDGGRSFAIPIAWKIQGNRGGEDIADPIRGVVNNGGLYGERMGWHLPGFDDRRWAKTADTLPGTRWHRTGFDLAVPPGQDATIGVSFGDPTVPRSARAYRVLIFVNGWNMGQFVAHVGPQRTFPIPEGILNHRGRNTLALAVTSDGAPGNLLEDVRLVTLRNVRGGVPVRPVAAPSSPGQLR